MLQLTEEVTALEESKAKNAAIFTDLLNKKDTRHGKALHNANIELTKAKQQCTDTLAYMVGKIKELAKSQEALHTQMTQMRNAAHTKEQELARLQEEHLQQVQSIKGRKEKRVSWSELPQDLKSAGEGVVSKIEKIEKVEAVELVEAVEKVDVVETVNGETIAEVKNAQMTSLLVINKSVTAIKALDEGHAQELSTLQAQHEALKVRMFDVQRERDAMKRSGREILDTYKGEVFALGNDLAVQRAGTH